MILKNLWASILLIVFIAVAVMADVGNMSTAWGSTFGWRGQSGRDGFSGLNGRSSQALVLHANGQPATYNLRGEDGTDGTDGENGQQATGCSYQPTPDENVFGADGGNGGSAGRGGNGGDGGDVTIYTNDINNLRSILVDSAGGRGARSGRFGYGASGCYCRYRSWKVTECHNVQQPDGTYKQVCNDVIRYCYDGDHGRDGSSLVSSGSDGSYGSLTLIPQLDPLPPVQETLSIAMSQILQGTFVLSKNIWLNKSGAELLLAPGSRIASSYQQYSHKQNYSIAFVWQAQRPLSDFSGATMMLSVSPSETGIVAQIPGVWFKSHEDVGSDIQKVTFEKAVFEKDVFRLVMNLGGSANSSVVAVIDDQASISDIVSTAFSGKLVHTHWYGDKTIYEGVIPSGVVERTGSGFTIRLGQIPGIDLKEMNGGNEIKLDLDISRSLGSFSQSQTLTQKWKIPQKK